MLIWLLYYNYAYLNRSYGEGLSSPQFNLPPIVKLCKLQPVYHNVAVVDTTNHDSISYSFDDPLSAYGTTIAYTGNYFAQNPFDAYYPGSLKYPYNNSNANPPIGVYLDQENGDLIFLPVSNINTVAVIKLTKWRKDTTGKMREVGIVRQDLQLTFFNCGDNNPPTIGGPYKYKVCVGEKICFNIPTDDKVVTPPFPNPPPPPDTVVLIWNGGIKEASFSIIDSKAIKQTGRFSWTPKENDASTIPYQFVAEARDNACPLNAVSRRAFQITVSPRVDLQVVKQEMPCNSFGYDLDTKNSSGFLEYTVQIKDSTNALIEDPRIAQFNSTNLTSSKNQTDTIQFHKKGKYFINYLVNDKIRSCPTLLIDTVFILEDFTNAVLVSDTFYCNGSDLTLYANSDVITGFSHHKWHTNNAADTLTKVTLNLSEKAYLLRFTAKDSKGCIVSDFVHIDRVDLLQPNLGNDTFIGAYNVLLFKGPSQQTLSKYYHSYLWHDANTSDSFKTKLPGTVTLTITNVCGSWSDTVEIKSVNQLLKPTLPVHFCKDSKVLIQSQLEGYKYRWQNAKQDTSFSILVEKEGIYNCEIILTSGDTILEKIVVIEEQIPRLHLPDTIYYCEGAFVDVSPGFWDQYTQTVWSDNSRDSVKRIKKQGPYTFFATNICGNFLKSTFAKENPLPKADLGADLMYCDTFSKTYDFSKSIDNCIWNDNSQLKVKTITQPGVFWIKAFNNCGAVTDTILIEQSFVPQVNLGRDTALKLPFSLLLDAENRGASYVWSNNDTSQTLLVTTFGTYWVKVTTPCGVATDSITITDAAGNEKYHIEGLKIYPNPTSGQLTISSSFAAIQKIKVFNVLGETLLSSTTNGMNHSITLDLSPLANGIYYVKIYFENGRVGVYNIVKNR